MAPIEPCSGCGRPGGTAACRADFEELVARDFGDAGFFAAHRLLVDTYSLQHPDEYCASAKSLAAHLVGLCLILEEGANAATGADHLNRWLEGTGALDKPSLPTERGRTTIADVAGIDQPSVWRQAVRRWADSTWDAYAELQPLARRWAAEARRARR